MAKVVSDPDAFRKLFVDFEHTAFKFEVRRAYGLPSEDLPFQQFLNGEDPGVEWLRDWLDLMREQTSTGKRVERVRVVDDPPSDYLRFEIFITPHNIAAGEDIRYLDRARARELQLPNHDFWLFDSRTLAILHFGEDDAFLGFEMVEDTDELLRHCYWRDVAWTRARRLSDQAR
ncbi:DUF6879 family protein [Micromonospora sp. HM5-17]|jgi:hypothetical protein|uniref:DUF6879 family protein n=1 Tax=Micromonospora sp. HM5-17 TaxID=2487710 RepID=UPI000F4670E1|nr:DUF6879 family protein [Micromonospora sp. HM5-17]ROT32387.1 hypothetical protein EF879_12605 [Micromonospora sp. HM5-17]